MRKSVVVSLCALALLAAWLLWPSGGRVTPGAKPSAGASASAPAPVTATTAAKLNPPATGTGATAANASANPSASRDAFRLSNTTKTIGELTRTPHAILLQNALIATDGKTDLPIPAHLRSAGDPGAYIVQARGVIDAPFRALLAAAGAQVVSYIPNNAYLVRISAAGVGGLAGNPLVQAVLPFEPYYKLQPSLLGFAVTRPQAPLPPGTALNLGLFAADAAATEHTLETLGAKIMATESSPFGPILHVLAPANWTTLAQVPGVQVLEMAHQRVLANDLSRVTVSETPDTISGITNNWLGLNGANVLVQVNDSGVDDKHPDFSIGGTAAVPGSVPPSRVTGFTINDTQDTAGHGTHVAGTIAGNGSMSINPTNVGAYAQGSVTNADFRGKAPLANLFSINYNYSDQVLQEVAATNKAPISNNSWVYGGDYDYDLAAASYDAATRDALPLLTGSQPVLFVFSAGDNGGGDEAGAGGAAGTIQSPATAKNVITVGALEQFRHITNIVHTFLPDGTTNTDTPWYHGTDSSNQVASYSARGNVGVGIEGAYGRFKPDVVTPGSFVVSTRSSQWDTNAYFDPTNVSVIPYPGQVVTTNDLNYAFVPVPANAVAVVITITSNAQSQPFPLNLPIYVQQSGYPSTTAYDFFTQKNGVSIPPDGGAGYIQQIQNNGFFFAVGDSTNVPVDYDMTVAIYTTNAVTSDYYSVLLGMDNLLGPWYRYETGTSMAAASVSGVLALIEDYFTNTLHTVPSPALLKAMLINGSRSQGGYLLSVTNGVNSEGWGLVNITNSLPLTTTNLTTVPNGTSPAPLFFVDQSPANALATGDRHTYLVNVNTNASYLGLQATLVWTDPPGDPSAAIKLVNSLTLVITNLSTGEVYYGNDISGAGYNQPASTNAAPNVDTINNVQNIILSPNQELLAGSYSVTVVGRSVNVNAVTVQSNNVVQDYALVVSVGAGEVPTAITSVTGPVFVSNPTGYQDLTYVITTNSPLMNQIVGANTPLLGTNTLALGTNTGWGPNGQLTVGMTNQWHFYVVTNNGQLVNGAIVTAPYAAFITFDAFDLSLPRMGVYADSVANATRPAADIDLYVSTDPSLTNLNPVILSNCLAGTVNASATGFGSSLSQGGTEFVYLTNSPAGTPYYIGVKSEDQMASEYAFLPVFSATPFSRVDPNGNLVVNGLLLPTLIPDGTPAKPGLALVFALAIPLIPDMVVESVTVTNWNQHQNFGDLFGALTFGTTSVVLNNHYGLHNTFNTGPLVYNDSANPPLGTTNTDGPGSLADYQGHSALGPWILTEMDNSQNFTGQVSQLTLIIQPHRKLVGPGVIVTVPPLGWFIDYVDVPPGYTNLTFNATNLPPTIQPPLEMFEQFNAEPTLTSYDQMALLTNCLFGTYPTGVDPGNSISVGPPLTQGRYFIGIYNPSTTAATNVFVSATLGFNSASSTGFGFANNSPSALPVDAVSAAANGFLITVPNTVTQAVASVNVGMAVSPTQISDYTFTLVSPAGQRVLLMENRGGTDTNGAGGELIYTNVINSTATGGAAANTNYLVVPSSGITVPITYNFYTVPDEMTVYAGNNPATFYLLSPTFLFDTGFTNNPAGPTTISVTVPPGYTNITIIMNQFGNPYASGGDAWIYTAGAVITNFQYLTFTDDTNLANVPIKFAIPPYSFTAESSNYTLSDFELATNGNYYGPTNIYDAYGGWTVPTNLVTISTVFNLTNNQFGQVTNVVLLTNNLVSVVTDPADALGDNAGTNLLALANGTITRSIATTPGRIYNVNFWYRGPGLASWWRGEGNASDSSDPENNANNGALVGRFNFPAGEVGQAFGFQDNGSQFEFAGTNTYVQVPQSTSLDVGQAGGFTVEGWINPTNLAQPQPLVEWLAKVPTNSAVTNLVRKAGPYLDPATGHYYYLLGATNWTVSEFWAKQLGGHLVTLDTANEQNWVFDNFANYGGRSRNLWLGLTNNQATSFGWISGLTNITYTNWLASQPFSIGNTRPYSFMYGGTNLTATNLTPGLWTLADNNGFVQGSPATNIVYGVVEVNRLQTNGVQFWISPTNTPGTTNAPFANTNGCLYADIVDTNYVAHEIFSAAGLLQSNVFQHVALTFDTNSGLAMLYLNGTNVATTNLFLTNGISVPFVPKTDGDVLLGRDMSLNTNNLYGGEMDEMSIYRRALSAAEISAIYRVSATATNGLTGKFDPTVTPAYGLAEALVNFGGVTNLIYGVNNQWSLNSYTFTAASNSMPLQITGLQPGILLDNFYITEAPLTNLYYFPEQALSSLTGVAAAGNWQLEVWNNRINAAVTNLAQLLSWQLSFVLESNATYAASLTPQTPTAGTVGAGQTVTFAVTVPAWATSATNILVSSTLPVSVFFNQTNPPTGTVPPDYLLLANATNGIGNLVLSINPLSTPPLLRGQTYYLGVQNNGIHAASVVLEVDYNITALTNDIPLSSTLTTNDTVRYFSFNVSSNAYAATFQLLKLSGNADLVVSKGVPLPTLTNSAYGSFNVSNLNESVYVLTNSSPVPLSAGTWYLGVVKRDSGAVNYTVLAKELDATGSPANTLSIIDLTNGVPVNGIAASGAALTNFFRLSLANNPALTNAPGLRFELYNLTGNGDLTVQTNAPPLAPPFFQTSQNPRRNPELILTYTNSALTNIATDWYLGVPNNEITNISYTILAVIDTNGYFPAFPGATGSGGGAAGGGGPGQIGGHGTNGTVYHVKNLNDSGLGSLRDAVSSTNRTVVFDVSGTINLASPLVITNSYLTLAGQTAPGGITVAGNMTTLSSAHDVIIRDVRFRPVFAVANTNSLNIDGSFENPQGRVGGTYSTGQTFGGWTVVSGDVNDILASGQQPADGTTSLDMNGNTTGTIARNVATATGQSYVLRFAYAGNPSGGPNPKTMQVSWDGSLLGTVSFNTTGYSTTNMGWVYTNFTVVGTGNDVLQFASTVGSQFGPALDAVSLTATTASGATGDSLQFLNASNVIADHISASWGAYNLVSVLNSSNVTVQWSIMADSLYNSNNPSALGSLLRYGSGALSFNHNLYADNYSGNPRLGDNLSLDFVNNVIYNWGLFPGLTGGTNDLSYSLNGCTNQLNYDCNYLIAGADTAYFGTNYAITNIAFFGGGTNALAANWIFSTNNLIDSDNNGVLNGANTQWAMFTNQYTRFSLPFPLVQVPTDEAYLAYEKVLDFAGVNLALRDPVDMNIVTKVRTQTGTIISSPPSSGLLSWWRAEGNGNDSADGNTALMTNTVTSASTVPFAPGEVGQAFDLHAFGPHLEVLASSNLTYSLNNGFTIECWINVTNVNGLHPICEWNANPDVAPPLLPIGVIFDLGNTPASLGVLACLLNDTNGVGHPISSPAGTMTANTWQHVGITYDRASGVATLYRNGVVVQQSNLGSFVPQTSYNLWIGYRPGDSIGTWTYHTTLGGLLDELSIYQRALSANEIKSVYNAGSTGKFAAPAAASPPYLDTDQDGIPDFWEITFGQSPTNVDSFLPSSNVNFLGYTRLEEYLAWLAGPQALTVTNTPVGVDLMPIFGKTGNLSFAVTNAVNGTVYLTNVLGGVTNSGPWSNSIAVFTPTNSPPFATNFSGYAAFDVTVTNNDTVAYFGPVTVSVLVSAVPVVYATNTNPPPTFLLTNATYNLTNNELVPLTVTNTATDVNTNVTLSYTLTTTIDIAAMISNNWTNSYANVTNTTPVIDNNGIITWTPSEAQGPGVYDLTTIVSDNGTPAMTATNTFVVTVNEVNTPPFWPTNVPSQTNYTIPALNLLVVTNTAQDADLPLNPLTYQLSVSLGVTNAVIDTNGIITWTPTLAQAPGVYTFTTIVTDTNQYAVNAKSLSTNNSFTVTVTTVAAPYAFTQPAQAVTGTNAQLNGMATPNGLVSTAWFQWGTNTAYGSNTPPVSIGSGYGVVYQTNLIAGLTPNVPYHFRLVVSNVIGTNYGFDQILDEANVVAWGANYVGQVTVPPGLSNVVAIAGAYDHNLALKNNLTAVGWGDNTFGQMAVPAGLNSNLLAVAGGESYSLALKITGNVVAWGANIFPGETNVPPGLTNAVLIASGQYSSLALRSSGNITAWGASISGLTSVPASLSNSAVAIAGGGFHNLAIRNDGTVVAWGDGSAGQTNVPASLTNVVAISAGSFHSLALKSDGTVVAWGDDGAGQTNVPAGLNNVVAVAAGGFHSLALKSDGTIVGWGDDSAGQLNATPGLTNFVAISAGNLHSLALTPQSVASLTNLVLNLTNGVSATNDISPGGITYYRVAVPSNADAATNSILYTLNGALNVWFTTNAPPSLGTNATLLFVATTNVVISDVLTPSSTPTNIVPGRTYYLGVQNTNNFSVNYGIEVTFHLIPVVSVPISSIIYTNIGGFNGFLLTWFAPSNDLFQVQFTTNLAPANWITFTNPPVVTYNTNSPVGPTNAQFNFFDDGTQAGGFGPSRFYRLLLLSGSPNTLTFPNPSNRVASIATSVTVTNIATDSNTNALLTYSLLSAPTNSGISLNGVITWTNAGPSGLAARFITLVTDNGAPPAQATNAFTVFVMPFPAISSVTATATNTILTWLAPTNDVFEVQWTTNLAPPNWQIFTNAGGNITISSGSGVFSFTDTNVPAIMKFYELILLP